MGDDAPESIELTCPTCDASFRLRPKKGKLPKGPIKCPKCGGMIPVTVDVAPPQEKSAAPSAAVMGMGVIRRRKKGDGGGSVRSTSRGRGGDAPEVPGDGPSGDPSADAAGASTTESDASGLFGGALDDISTSGTFMGLPLTMSSKGDAKKTDRDTKETRALTPEDVGGERVRAFDALDALDEVSEEVGSTTDKGFLSQGERPERSRDEDLSFASDPFASVESAHEPGPFDLRDILEAEKQQISPEAEGSVTRNPLLDQQSQDGPDMFGRPNPTRAKPIPPMPVGMVGEDLTRVPTRPTGEPALVAADSEGESSQDPSEPAERAVAEERELELHEPVEFDAPEVEPESASGRDVDVTSEEASEEASDQTPDETPDGGVIAGESEEGEEGTRSELAERLKSKFGKKKLTNRLSAIRAKREESEESEALESSESSESSDSSVSSSVGAELDGELDLEDILGEEESAGIVEDVFDEVSRASESEEVAPEPPLDQGSVESGASTGPDDVPVSELAVTADMNAEDIEKEDGAPPTPSIPPPLPSQEGPTAEYESKPEVAAAAAATLADEKEKAKDKAEGPGERKLDLGKLAKLKASGKAEKSREQKGRRLPRPGRIREGSSPSRKALDFDLPSKPEERVNSLGGEVSNAYENLRRGRGHGRRRKAGESQSGLIVLPDVRGGMFGEDEPGAASERRGSGYIRLPTSEILEVLGSGTYRILVEDIEYGPVDEKGLTELIKGGVLMGAEMIAQGDGEWQPIADHPVFRRLRRKMATEAHAMLAKYNADQKAKADKSPSLTPPLSPLLSPGLTPADAPEESLGALLDSISEEAIEETSESKEVGDIARDDSEPKSVPVGESGGDEAGGDEAGGEESQPEVSRPFVGTLPMGAIPQRRLPGEDEAGEVEKTVEPAAASQDTAVIDFPAHLSGEMPAVSGDEEPERGLETEGGESEEQPQEEAQSQDEDAPDGEVMPVDESVAEPVAAVARPPRPSAKKPRVEFEITEEKKSRAPIIALLVLLVGLVVGGVYLMSQSETPNTGEVGEVVEPKDDGVGEDEVPRGGSIDAAVEQARAGVRGALVELASPSDLMGLARGLMESGDSVGAASALGVVWSRDDSDADLGVLYGRALVSAQRFGEAREVARELMVRDSPGAREIFLEAIKKDQELSGAEALEIDGVDMVDAIEVLDTDRAITLKLSKDGAPAFAFKASQAGWEDGWRVDVASWRLCEIVGCGFKVMRNRPAKIEEKAFKALAKGAPAGLVRELRWVTEKGEDGKRRRVLYGALEDWPGEGVYYPVVRTEGWRDWTNVESDPKGLSEPFAENLKGFSTPSRPDLKSEANGVTVGEVGSAMAGLITFDFLTNNWERFVGTKTHAGPGLQLIDGEVVALDPGTAFASRASTRVEDRFGWISRFNGGTVAALRAVERTTMESTLFPNASGTERARMRVFWGQRTKLLRRVDGLVKRHDAARVMPF